MLATSVMLRVFGQVSEHDFATEIGSNHWGFSAWRHAENDARTECQWEVPTSELASWGLEDQRQTCWPTSWVAPHQTRIDDPNTSIHSPAVWAKLMVGSFLFQGGGYASFPFNGPLFVADNSLTSKANCRPCRPPFWLRCAARWPWLRPRRCWWRSRGDACGGFPQGATWRITFLAKICGEKVPMLPPSWWKNKNVGLMRKKCLKKPCLAPYRNSCKEISPSPSSIMLNLKKFHNQLHTPSWVDGTEKAKQGAEFVWKTSLAKSAIFKVYSMSWQSPIARMVAESTDFHIWKTKSSSTLPAKKISVFNGSPRGSSTQCPTDSPNHDSRAPKWPTNFAASGCSIQHWILSKSEHLRDLVAGWGLFCQGIRNGCWWCWEWLKSLGGWKWKNTIQNITRKIFGFHRHIEFKFSWARINLPLLNAWYAKLSKKQIRPNSIEFVGTEEVGNQNHRPL